MNESSIEAVLNLSLTQIKRIILTTDKLSNQPEFKDSAKSKDRIITLQKTLEYSNLLLKQLYQTATVHTLKKDLNS